MFSQDLTLKYVDFGSSRRITGSEKNFSGGTPRYMSPEAINGSRVAAIDVWSLGCVVLEMVTGHLPWEKQFPVGNEQSLMYHVGQGKAGAPPLLTSKQLGPPCIDFLEQCFKLDPEMRSTVHELLDHEWIKGS
jgi:mitogen-activated protein kinase kinase kinase